MHRIIILGPQGSGKGTQAKILADKLGLPALSMGALLRDEVASGSELGKKIDDIINVRGELVPDDVALKVLSKRLEQPDARAGYILDGYPRNLAQYQAFQRIDQPTMLLIIDVPREESLKRLISRAEKEKRPDDTPELIARRLQIYEEDTRPVIEEYRTQGLVKIINGVGSVEDVAKRVEEAINYVAD